MPNPFLQIFFQAEVRLVPLQAGNVRIKILHHRREEGQGYGGMELLTRFPTSRSNHGIFPILYPSLYSLILN